MFLRAISFSLLLVFRCCVVYAQSGDFVKSQGITFPMHQAHVGKIVFTTKEIPAGQLQVADFVENYELTNKSNLFITVFMGNSLTNYLHPLAMELDVDSLAKAGNYQFTFYVDNRRIYETNLHPGAPYARIKNFETVISKPLINNQNEGAWWSQSAWNRFMINGGDSALSDGAHLFRLEIRPYVQQAHLKVGEIIASGEMTMDVKRKPQLDLASIELNTPRPYSDLKVSTEKFDVKKIKALKGNIEADVFRHITSIVVIRNGKILIEEYFNQANRNTLHDVRSVGKTFASTLVGIALKDGFLKSENQPLVDFYDLKLFANHSEAKEKTTLKELLTMSSGFDGNDSDMNSPGNEENMYPSPDWVKFAVDLPVKPSKFAGEWHYFTAGVVILGDLLNKTVPGNLDSYSKEKLFDPLGIHNYRWQYTPQNVVNTAGGIQMNALDFAKYGQLYKNQGKWNGKSIISADWVAKSFSKYKVIPGRREEYYGYLFWNRTYNAGGRAYETFYCAGNGGNKIFIFKDQPLVVVVTATAYNTSYAHAQVDRMMEEFILPAILK